MSEFAVTVRAARPEDAAAVARVYIDSWHDAYPGVVPNALLCAMTPKGQTSRWQSTIRAHGREAVFVAEHAEHGVVAMTSFGPARDRTLSLDAEVYTLYVDPAFFGMGVGRALLSGAFGELHRRAFTSCIIWAHAKNPARFFYERLGGRLVAERMIRMMGDPVPEAAFGWKRLTLVETSLAR